MGGVVGTLLRLWCFSGCNTARVTAHLLFFPPEPGYSFARDEGGTYHFRPVARTHRAVEGVEGVEGIEGVEGYVVETKRGGSLPVILLRSPGARATIIYSHGNATDMGGMYHRYEQISRCIRPAVNVVAYDYRGYGVASGTTTERSTYEDLEAVYEWALTRVGSAGGAAGGGDGGDGHRFILYGQSVGCGPSLRLASRRHVSGLVLHSPFLSGMRVMTPVRALACLDVYPNVDRIRGVRCPVFILHGLQDEDVGCHHGMELQERVRPAQRHEPWWVPDRGHNDICAGAAHQREYARRLSAFVRRVCDAPTMDGLVDVKAAR